MNELLNQLDNVVLKVEGLKDILAMVSDCASEGGNTMDDYTMGFSLIFRLAYDNAKELNDIKERLFEEVRKVAK